MTEFAQSDLSQRDLALSDVAQPGLAQADLARDTSTRNASAQASPADDSDKPALSVRHLTKTYAHASSPVLNDVSFDVPKGKVFVVLGPSGSGKSTLLRAIAGLEPIQGGTIALHGDVIDDGKPGRLTGRS